MTPCEVEVLMHCYYKSYTAPESECSAVKRALVNFIHDGIITLDRDHSGEGEEGVYQTTPRGAALVKMICATPYPELAWLDPRTREVLDA
jgi:hypothetical protein